MPKVSVIIPVYNVEKYLKECLDSVINQTLEDIEIICINDGSTDKSGEILDEYAQNDDRIKVFHKQNGGYGKAMNIGLDNALGDYIGIVEPDDYIKPEMFEMLYSKAKENDADIVKSDFYRFTGDGNNRKFERYCLDFHSKSDKYYNKIINLQEDIFPFKFTMNTWSGIYKKEFIEKYHIRHNQTPGASFQDNGFWFQTFMFAKRAYFLDTPFYMNRRDNPNSSVKDKEKVYAIKYEYDFIREIIERNTGLKHKYIGIFWYKKYTNYIATLRRIHNSLRKEFIEIFHKEFKNADENKELDISLFSNRQKYLLNLIINTPEDFERKIYLYMSVLDYIFSIKQNLAGTNYVITISGIKIKIERKQNAKS